jgi:Rod binding domain-containing protein
LKKATTALEGFMFKSLLQAMGGKDGLFSAKVPGGQIYRDMFEQSMSETLSERGTLGIGDQIYNKVAPMAIQAARARFLETQKQAPTPSIHENQA